MSLAFGDEINETKNKLNDKFDSILFFRFIVQRDYKRKEIGGNAVVKDGFPSIR